MAWNSKPPPRNKQPTWGRDPNRSRLQTERKMPSWIHERADHLRAKNPDMPKSQSFAIATQQAYGAGKAPKKDFGTAEGKRVAKAKYDEPKKEYKQTADPRSVGKAKFGGMALRTVEGFTDELQKIADATTAGDLTKTTKKPSSLFSKPKMTSKPTMKEPEPPSSTLDQLSSSKSIQPPPVTSAVAPGT
jgi:hypothetical protein